MNVAMAPVCRHPRSPRRGIAPFLGLAWGLVMGMVGWVGLTTASAEGAPGKATRHWAFAPLSNPVVPDGRGDLPHPVDRFMAEGWAANGLTPVPLADARTLLRRLHYDLHGLPPTDAEVREFEADPAPDAWERRVDRLLASPRYGERWGRHWLDVARYADTAGDNADYPVPEARLYRDYVIDAFNTDKPYDEFVREQLAGDLLAADGPRERYAERVVATGFLALSRRYATAPFELMHLTIEDSIETAGRAFLGMTLRCARCHDHKFDPISRDEYYGLYGFFSGTRYPYAGSEEFESKKLPRTGLVPLRPASELAPLMAEHDRRIGQLRGRVEELSKGLKPGDKPGEELRSAQRELRRLEKFGAPPGVPVAYAVADDRPGDAPVQLRGEPGQTGPPARRRPPSALGPSDGWHVPEGMSGRRQFADWLTRPDNPLPARVMVNRIWQHHFGVGLVSTPSNFGSRGAEPSHPALLDYLARRFIDSGWSVKSLHRLILTSRTWRLASDTDAVGIARDPGNRMAWRHGRRRLEAEEIRDTLMSIAGRLDLARPGEHPFPGFDDWHWTQHNPFKAVYASPHRSVYLMTQRLQRHPFLALFDAPDANVSTDVRARSTVPQQALFALNDGDVGDWAGAWAARVLASHDGEEARLASAWSEAWQRPPSGTEVAAARRFLDGARTLFRSEGMDPGSAETAAWARLARLLMVSNEMFHVD